MKILFFVLTLLLFQANLTFAQTPSQEPLSLEQRLGIIKPEPLPPSSAENVKQLALRYYNECTDTEGSLFSKETRQLQCGCIANTMIDVMEPDVIMSLYEDNDAGIQSRSIFLTRVHGVCAKYPTYDHVKNKCMSNKGFQQSMLSKHRDVCECTADTMARFINYRSTEKMMDQLKRTPQSQDPLKDFIEGREFVTVHNNFMRQCVLIHIIDPP